MEVAIGSAMELSCNSPLLVESGLSQEWAPIQGHSPERQEEETGSPLMARSGQGLPEAACKPTRSYGKFHRVGTYSRPLWDARKNGNDGKSSVQHEISRQALARSVTWRPRPCWPRSPWWLCS